jgi:peptidyl-prolyl cis-trans isomerase A (cyclophilin A)
VEIRRIARAAAFVLPALVLAASVSVPGRAQDPAGAASPKAQKEAPVVELQTSKGAIRIALEAEKAPRTVENFLAYVDAGFYDGTIFHRVIPGFMVQGGGFAPGMEEKKTRGPISNEADNGLRNLRGTLAMARTQAKDSATSQFFINLTDNAFLDHGARDFGYAVFARVVDGMDVVDRIAEVETTRKGGHGDVPVEPVVIESARRVEGGGGE